MDFQKLLDVAASKQKSLNKQNVSRYSLDLPAAKKEVKQKPSSDVILKLKEEKLEELRRKERLLREEKEKREREERKKNQFKIPKRKPDTETLINSLFDDSVTDDSSRDQTKSARFSEKENGLSPSSSSSSSTKKEKSSHVVSSSKSEKNKDSGDKNSHNKHQSSPSSHHRHHKSSSSSSKTDSSKSSSSSHEKHKASSTKYSSRDSKDSGDRKHVSGSSHSSSSSKPDASHSSSSKKLSSSSTSRSSSSSKSSSSSTPSKTVKEKNTLPLSSKPDAAQVSQGKPSEDQHIGLTKHHLNPLFERHAETSHMSEKEKILAKLAAIKERTLAAINKESSSKGKRGRSEKKTRRSRGDDKDEDRTKSVEIVRDIPSSDDEEIDNSVPSALDIMLSERNAKLEKDKISRMAKQAWERATKSGSSEEVKVKKKKKSHRSGEHKPVVKKDVSSKNHKAGKRAHSLSPDPDERKPKVKKQLVKHANNAAPPPMDFKTILAMAEKKQHEPTKPAAAPTLKKKKKEEQDRRPLTQEEIDRKERVKSKEYQDWLKFGGKRPSQKDDDDNEEPKESVKEEVKSKTSHTKLPSTESKPSSFAKYVERENQKHLDQQRHYQGSNGRHGNITVNENVLVCGPAEESAEETPSPMPKKDDLNPFDRIYSQVRKHRQKPVQASHAKKMQIDSEEEDSDMDGFIDDGDDDNDYSKEIQKIFGYKKSKYKYEDEGDLSDMEADFSTVMMEEKRSAKLGLMEDLEDMRKEQEELRRKALYKKQKLKGREK